VSGIVVAVVEIVIVIAIVGARGRVGDLAPSRDRRVRKVFHRDGAVALRVDVVVVVVVVRIGSLVGAGVGVETRFEGAVVRTIIDGFHGIVVTAVATTALLHTLVVVEWVHPMIEVRQI